MLCYSQTETNYSGPSGGLGWEDGERWPGVWRLPAARGQSPHSRRAAETCTPRRALEGRPSQHQGPGADLRGALGTAGLRSLCHLRTPPHTEARCSEGAPSPTTLATSCVQAGSLDPFPTRWLLAPCLL